MDLKELDLVDPNFNWYYQHKAKYIYTKSKNYINQINNLIDVGAGSGFFAKYFQERSPKIKAYCIDPFYSDDQLKEEGNLQFLKQKPNVKAEALLFIDVLEHVEDDIKLIEDYKNNMDQETCLIISVPAFNFLWSGHDIFLEHYRRYTLKNLKTLLLKAGFEPVYGSYIFSTIFPLVYLKRKFTKNLNKSDMREFNRFVNWLFLNICKLEYFLPINKLFGTSVFVIARKKHV